MSSIKEDFLLLKLFVYFFRRFTSLAESSPGMIKTNIEQHIYHIRVQKFDKLPVEMNNSRNML